ncbi:MAG: Nif11-like leader peptide family natural product precursor [Lachnospiraceae bacterium]|nr:Nif11-like leader peptide family natural product precursor [Lachnospiraceae bacterium]
MSIERMDEVFKDDKFVETLLAMETPEEMQNALAEKGVEVSLEEVVQAKNLVSQYQAGELTEEELENVAGGMSGGAKAMNGLISKVVGWLVKCIFDKKKNPFDR